MARDGAQAVVLDDPGHSISKTHLEFGLDQGRPWVKDRGSTNGSTITRPGQSAQRLEPKTQVYVAAGDIIGCGHSRFEVWPGPT
ncbi:MAG: FHA domain-containing protein [Propionibacteriaceae bacterium]|nr:FHA domain-containing protein [Propionibacteriaceae bacterium]